MTGAAMERFRQRLFATTLTTLLLYSGTVGLGALRVCWGTRHLHSGVAADDCPMHHHAGSQPAHHGHHGHESGTATSNGDNKQISCGCSSDPTSPYVGPTGIVVSAVSVAHVESHVVVIAGGQESGTDHSRRHRVPPPYLVVPE
jgi:hypothetical protein